MRAHNPTVSFYRYLYHGQWVETPDEQRGAISDQDFASEVLPPDQVNLVTDFLAADLAARQRSAWRAEFESKELSSGTLKMPFDFRVFGSPGVEGRSLFISMHGGGGAPARVNDRQWENQKRLYEPPEGV